MSVAESRKEELIARLDALPLSRWHYKLVFAGGMGVLLDSFDLLLISFILPSIALDWKLSSVQMASIGSMGLMGMMLGAMFCGWLADRIGRKKVFILTLLIFSLSSGVAIFSTSLTMLLALRVICGFGLGAEQPVANTITSEMTPPEYRGRLLGMQLTGFGVGSVVASLVAIYVIPSFGWKGGFLIGALPAFFVFYLWRNLPESVRWLVKVGRYQEARAIVEAAEKESGVRSARDVKVSSGSTSSVAEKRMTAAEQFLALWSKEYWRRSLGVWILWFAMVFSFYGLYTWLPSFMVRQGLGMAKGFATVMAMNIAQIPGIWFASYFVDRIGRRRTIGIFMVLSAFFAIVFSFCSTAIQFAAVGFCLMFFLEGAFCMMHIFTTEQYPTQMRATGYGFGSAFGRVGGVVAPMVVGILLTTFGNRSGFVYSFGVFAVAFLVGVIAMWTFCPETAKLSLEIASGEKVKAMSQSAK